MQKPDHAWSDTTSDCHSHAGGFASVLFQLPSPAVQLLAAPQPAGADLLLAATEAGELWANACGAGAGATAGGWRRLPLPQLLAVQHMQRLPGTAPLILVVAAGTRPAEHVKGGSALGWPSCCGRVAVVW